jgi:hypothetical protein
MNLNLSAWEFNFTVARNTSLPTFPHRFIAISWMPSPWESTSFGISRGSMAPKSCEIGTAADGMRDAGWPGFELRRWNNGLWTATFYRYTDDSLCTIKAQGKGKTITEAILKAKERAD